MRTVIQRVGCASVAVEGKLISEIKSGLLILLGISCDDSEKDAQYLVDKIVNLRIFEDENGKMNLSACDLKKEIMVISQFTLYGDCRKGRRPSFTQSMDPEKAEQLYEFFINQLILKGFEVKKGIFGAKMHISLINEGPVTFVIDSIIV